VKKQGAIPDMKTGSFNLPVQVGPSLRRPPPCMPIFFPCSPTCSWRVASVTATRYVPASRYSLDKCGYDKNPVHYSVR